MDTQIRPTRVYYRFEEIEEADADAAVEMAPARRAPRTSIFTDDPEKVGFWRRQFGETVSGRQKFWDWTLGVGMPLVCFYFDPIVFREWSGGQGMLLARFQMPVYVLAYGSIMALAAWLLWGHRLGPFKLTAGLVMAGGAVMASILAVILFPFALVGSLFIIGLLGFTPIFTAIIYWRNAARALRAAGRASE